MSDRQTTFLHDDNTPVHLGAYAEQRIREYRQENEQSADLERVTSRIGQTIVAFFRARRAGDQFHASDLLEYIAEATKQAAPASPDRVMRDLRQRGLINYECIKRSESLYEVRSLQRP